MWGITIKQAEAIATMIKAHHDANKKEEEELEKWEYILYMAMDDLHYDENTPEETLKENTRIAHAKITKLQDSLAKKWKDRLKDSSVSHMQEYNPLLSNSMNYNYEKGEV
jgi:exopolyphosphatase/pppGpp-phosphohydrolase|tara:strand:+ start:274 stop:603 length:330 start_codon:yes stop_codon:yes gene_type:complete